MLRVESLRVAYDHPLGAVKAVDDVSFALRPGERFGLAGESGSGKSTMALAILRMIKPPGRIEGGAVWLEDTRHLALVAGASSASSGWRASRWCRRDR